MRGFLKMLGGADDKNIVVVKRRLKHLYDHVATTKLTTKAVSD